MAVVCALAVVLALLLPVTQSREDAAAQTAGRGAGRGDRTAAGDCTDADAQNRSPAPDSGPRDGPAVRKIVERGSLVVGVDQNSYRWGYRDPNSESKTAELEGFDIDLAHAIAKDILGDEDKIVFRAVPTSERITAIQKGDVDMVVRTMTINCDRLEQVAFSSPYFRTGQQVLAPKGSDIEGYDSLSGRRVCAAKKSIAEDTLTDGRTDGDLSASTAVTVVPNQLDCLVRLQLGEVDAVVTDGALAASQAAQDPTVTLKGEPFTKEYYGVAMKRGADDLVRRVNAILVDYRKSEWQKSYDTWLLGTLGRSDGPPAVTYE
ncbi:glutamate ABC transporter substrate-binding protein [Streptomyces apricus]|uniref:Glutamate ABC transporter substrate-binding protein n=1 Tax=Streptomyces apricus TaxID=1828112 RepID=A0A5B0ATJ0_9ACTN|nr:glutamate ABC transporter substrate-binding protein [Streptomyces apricus]